MFVISRAATYFRINLFLTETNQEFQNWYSEDLFKRSYCDNGYEKTCVAVYGLYVWIVGKIWKYIKEENAKIVVHTFITSI